LNVSEKTSETLIDIDILAYEDARIHNPALWLATYYHRSARDSGMDFVNRPWQYAIYKDTSRDVIVRKSSQVGITEWAVVELFRHLYGKRRVLYTMPTEGDRNEFVADRINPLLKGVEFYSNAYKLSSMDPSATAIKKIFNTTAYFEGSNSKTAFYSKVVDVLFIDEYDKCDPTNLEYSYDRIGSSEDPYIYRFGNPTIDGFGIEELYKSSDQKRWLIECPSCGERQELDWFTHFIDKDDNVLIAKGDEVPCSSCGKFFNRLIPGEWTPANPGADASGYAISKLFADNRDISVVDTLYKEWILSRGNATKRQRFFNNVLGKPFRECGDSISKDILFKCKDTYLMPDADSATILGCDVGSLLNIIILKPYRGVYRTVYIGTVKDFDDLHLLWHRYGVSTGVIDAMPETREVQNFTDTHANSYACWYTLPYTAKESIVVDDKTMTIRANKTSTLDDQLACWIEGRFILPENYSKIPDFVDQMTAATRIKIERKGQSPRNSWEEGSKADHYHHAFNYANIGTKIYGTGSYITGA